MPSPLVHPYPLIFCDLENIIGSGALEGSDVTAAAAFLKDLFPHPRTHWIVGVSSRHAAQAALFNWPEPKRLVIGRGHNGADHRLIEAMREAAVERFAEVVLCSGDGIFAEQLTRFAERGVRITLVTGRGGTASKLQQAAHRRMRIHVGPPQSAVRQMEAARAEGRVVVDRLPPPPPRLAFTAPQPRPAGPARRRRRTGASALSR